LISKWKKELIDRGSDLFEKGYKPAGELSMEVDFLKK